MAINIKNTNAKPLIRSTVVVAAAVVVVALQLKPKTATNKHDF